VDLAVIYLNGQIIPRDPELGIKWLKRAARHDYPAADFLLGVAYENGEGVKADVDRALEFYRKAAEKGHPAAQNNLGRMYFQGSAGQQDRREAQRLFSAAAEQGNGQSYLNLALCSLVGCAGVIDATAAYSWYLSAEASGAPIPQLLHEKFTQLAKQLDENQTERAQSNSQAWIKEHPSADPRTPVQLSHIPNAAFAANQQPRIIDNSEVFKTLWQQTPYMPPHLPNRDSVR
jgi:TPR repeat protein